MNEQILLGFSGEVLGSLEYLERQLDYINKTFKLKIKNEDYNTKVNKLLAYRILSGKFSNEELYNMGVHPNYCELKIVNNEIIEINYCEMIQEKLKYE